MSICFQQLVEMGLTDLEFSRPDTLSNRYTIVKRPGEGSGDDNDDYAAFLRY